MAKLQSIKVEGHADKSKRTLHVEWDNDRHQAVQINGDGAADVLVALEILHRTIDNDLFNQEI
jgi:hypothetical protein